MFQGWKKKRLCRKTPGNQARKKQERLVGLLKSPGEIGKLRFLEHKKKKIGVLYRQQNIYQSTLVGIGGEDSGKNRAI